MGICWQRIPACINFNARCWVDFGGSCQAGLEALEDDDWYLTVSDRTEVQGRNHYAVVCGTFLRQLLRSGSETHTRMERCLFAILARPCSILRMR
jgi:hypothetical protein